MPRTALLLILFGLVAILGTVLLVMGDATLPGHVPPVAAALLAAAGGLSLVSGLALLDPGRYPQPFSG